MWSENKVGESHPAILQHSNTPTLHHCRAKCSRSSGVRGFTIIELLLVITILGIVVAIIAPSMARSIKGNRLRTGLRSVVMAGRYARSMAVLRQTTMSVTFDLDAGSISVDQLAPAPSDETGMNDYGDTAEMESTPDPVIVSDGDFSDIPENTAVATHDLSRKLDGVTIEYVEMTDTDEQFTEGTCRILYRSNGRCTPHRVRIIDEQGGSATLDVDTLASAVTKEGA